MVLILKKGTDRKSILKSLRKITKQNRKGGFNAAAFHGKLKRGLDGLNYQRNLRNEWD